MCIINDIKNLIENIKNSYDKELYDVYLNKNQNLAAVPFDDSFEIVQKRNLLLSKQRILSEKILDELNLFDCLDVPIIGLKGVFLKNKYYCLIDRSFDDIDILVSSINAKKMYNGLRELGYHIELKTMYDNPIINMKMIPEYYMNNTQTLMMINSKKNISIDIHSNLNITNAHFINSPTKFDTKILFDNSVPFETYKNIRTLELHDNLCILFRHLLKHHVFYGKTQMGLQTPIQHVLDLAVLINSNDFDIDMLFKRVIKYNIVPEAIFCLNLYNKIFKSCKQIDIIPYLNYLNKINYKFTWKPVLMGSLDMDVEDVMIGNYEKKFPKLQHAVNFSQSMPSEFLNWLCQSFIISFSIKYLLK